MVLRTQALCRSAASSSLFRWLLFKIPLSSKFADLDQSIFINYEAFPSSSQYMPLWSIFFSLLKSCLCFRVAIFFVHMYPEPWVCRSMNCPHPESPPGEFATPCLKGVYIPLLPSVPTMVSHTSLTATLISHSADGRWSPLCHLCWDLGVSPDLDSWLGRPCGDITSHFPHPHVSSTGVQRRPILENVLLLHM